MISPIRNAAYLDFTNVDFTNVAIDPKTRETFTLAGLVDHANALEEQVDKLQRLHAKEVKARLAERTEHRASRRAVPIGQDVPMPLTMPPPCSSIGDGFVCSDCPATESASAPISPRPPLATPPTYGSYDVISDLEAIIRNRGGRVVYCENGVVAGAKWNGEDLLLAEEPAPSPEARLVAVYRELLELADRGGSPLRLDSVETAASCAARDLAPVVAPILARKAA